MKRQTPVIFGKKIKFENKYVKDITKLEIIVTMQGNIKVMRIAYVN